MFGWFSAARVLASRWNRAIRSASATNRSGRTLIATSRSSFVSRARYSSPVPPRPMIEQTPCGVGLEGDQEIDVAGGAEVRSERGSEHGELADLPTSAPTGERILWQANRKIHRHPSAAPSYTIQGNHLPATMAETI